MGNGNAWASRKPLLLILGLRKLYSLLRVQKTFKALDAAAFDAGENASVASVASAYKAAQLFTQEDLEMLAGFQVGDELLNDRWCAF